MKKIISIMTAAVVIASLSTSAFAATENVSKIDSKITALQERQEKISERKTANNEKLANLTSKVGEFKSDFRKAMTEKRITAIENKGKNLSLGETNIQLLIQNANTFKALKENGTKLPEETVLALKDYKNQIKDIKAAAKESKGDIKKVIEENKEKIKAKDFAALDSTAEQVYSIQNTRSKQLEQINSILKEVSSLLTSSTK